MQQIDVYLRLDPDIECAVAGEKLNQRLLRNPRTVNQLGGGAYPKAIQLLTVVLQYPVISRTAFKVSALG